MAKGKQRQALALTARHAAQSMIPGILGSAIVEMEKEAARIVREDEEKRLNGGTSFSLVCANGRLSGIIKDKHTTVRFAGGQAAVTAHD